MAKSINLTDLYSVSENRFKQSKTYNLRSPLDGRWQLVASPSGNVFMFIESINSCELNLQPTAMIFIADSDRLKIQGAILKQTHIVGTEVVRDPDLVIKGYKPEYDYSTGMNEKLVPTYNHIEQSHEENYDYMEYTIGYTFTDEEIMLLASASKLEILLQEDELSHEVCTSIHYGAKLLCSLAGIKNFKDEVLQFLIKEKEAEEVRKKKEAKETAKRRAAKKAAEEEARKKEKIRQIPSIIITSLLFFVFICLVSVVILFFVSFFIDSENPNLDIMWYSLYIGGFAAVWRFVKDMQK